jgi:hypothetical protein
MMADCVPFSDLYPVVVDTSTSLVPPDSGPPESTPPDGTLVIKGAPGLDDLGKPIPLDVGPLTNVAKGGTGGTNASTQVSGDHTFATTGAGSEIGKIVESTSDTPVTWTIPSGTPEGGIIEVFQYGAGQVTITSAGPSIISDGGKVMTAGQYATIGIRIRTGGSEAVLSGDLTDVAAAP